MVEKRYDTDKMAEIIFASIQNFGKDRMNKFMIERLIREESAYLVPSRKSTGVLGLEQLHGTSLTGLTSQEIYQKNKELSEDIIIEHGLPIGQAIDMCFEVQDKESVKNILEEIKNNIVYITTTENKLLSNYEQRSKGASGFYWEEVYKTCGIKLVDNSSAMHTHKVFIIKSTNVSQQKRIGVTLPINTVKRPLIGNSPVRNYKNLTKHEAKELCRENGFNLNDNITFASKNTGVPRYWANPNIRLLQ
jgi:cupin superfamily acireductone dioxygenase involved in methionine salvage